MYVPEPHVETRPPFTLFEDEGEFPVPCSAAHPLREAVGYKPRSLAGPNPLGSTPPINGEESQGIYGLVGRLLVEWWRVEPPHAAQHTEVRIHDPSNFLRVSLLTSSLATLRTETAADMVPAVRTMGINPPAT